MSSVEQNTMTLDMLLESYAHFIIVQEARELPKLRGRITEVGRVAKLEKLNPTLAVLVHGRPEDTLISLCVEFNTPHLAFSDFEVIFGESIEP